MSFLSIVLALTTVLATTPAAPAKSPVAPAKSPVAPAKPAKYPSTTAETLTKTMYSERERSENWFRTNPQSYLAAVQRKDFGDRKTLIVGRAEGSDIRIDDPLIRPRHLQITVLGDSFRVQALDDSALFRVGGGESRDSTIGPASIDLGKYNYLWGRYTLRLSHQNFPALVLFDAFSKRFPEYRGLKHYRVDLDYRFTLPMTKNPKPDTIAIASTRGTGRRAVRLGWFDFMIGTTPCRLTALHMLEPGIKPTDIAVFFRDATSGKETYALGRYLETRRLGTSDNYLLDFNLAQNPACAFSDLYNCPIPPQENTLKVEILAGEKDMGYMSASAKK